MTMQVDLKARPSVKYVYDFAEGDREMVDLLGGKGAGLAEMTRLGLPVPPGFTITTEACRQYLRDGAEPAALRVQVTMALRRLEDSIGGLVEASGDERFAWDSYRRLIQMFGKTVLDIDGGLFAEALDAAKRDRGVTADVGLDAG